MVNVGSQVRNLRSSRGWTQTDLAYRAGMHPAEISRIENGRQEPKAGTLVKLADALGVGVGDLFEDQE
jgi:transcriptional regulator with XRE-family HTH domain